MAGWLYRYEAKGIQDWILQSQKLTDIRAASDVVEALGKLSMRHAADAGAGDDVLLATAGVGLIHFRSETALRAFAAEWPMQVAQAAPGLRFVQAWATGENAGALSSVIDLAAGQRNLPVPSLPEGAPFVRRSNRTGGLAVRKDGDEAEWVDAALATIRGRAAGVDGLRDRFGVAADIKLSDNLQTWPDGYVAVIHIDGNAIGGCVRGLAADKLHDFSRKLSAATSAAAQAATAAATVKWAKQFGTSRDMAFRPLILGGDDVTVLLHSSLALTFVEQYLTTFEIESKNAHPSGLTACAGIAFVKRTFPFSQAHHLAEELCRSAKNANSGGNVRSRVMLHRVTTSALRAWESVEELELAGVLVGGPYLAGNVDVRNEASLVGLQKLSYVLSLYRLPRGPLREWVAIVREAAVEAKRRTTHAGDAPTAETRDTFGRANKHWERMMQIIESKRPAARRALSETLITLGVDPNSGLTKVSGGAETRSASLPHTPLYDALTLWGLGHVEAK